MRSIDPDGKLRSLFLIFMAKQKTYLWINFSKKKFLWCPGRDLNSYTIMATASKTVVSTIPPPGQIYWAEKQKTRFSLVKTILNLESFTNIENGGPGRIRTCEVVDKGFTVLPIWPLWNRPRKKRVFESWTFRFLDGQYPIFQNSNIPKLLKWSHQSDLNWWPSVYKTDALPTELWWRTGTDCIKKGPLVKKFWKNIYFSYSHIWKYNMIR